MRTLTAGLAVVALAPLAAAEPSTLVAPPTAHTLGFRRVTATQIKFLVPGFSLEDPAGIAVARLASTDDPETRSDDDEVTLVVVDRGSGRVLTNLGLTRLGTWSGEDTTVGPLRNPTDVAMDREGRVAVTDTGGGRIVLLQHDGASLRETGTIDGFVEPVGIAADGRGGFLVCDRGNGSVIQVDAASGARRSFGLEVAFERPTFVALTPDGERLSRGTERAVVIVDRDGQRLRSFGPQGSLRGTVEAASLGLEGASFGAVEIDYHGNVYAADAAGHRLHKLRADLLPLHTFGGRGTDPGEFLSPRGIAIHRRLGQVFVTEEQGGQYLWVGTDVADFRAEGGEGGVAFSFRLTEDSLLTFRILDRHGREVATIVPERRLACGPQQGTWDGTDSLGKPAPKGSYQAEIRARATYSSGTRFEKKVLETFRLEPGSSGEPRP